MVGESGNDLSVGEKELIDPIEMGFERIRLLWSTNL
jgi:hypothetical protein